MEWNTFFINHVRVTSTEFVKITYTTDKSIEGLISLRSLVKVNLLQLLLPLLKVALKLGFNEKLNINNLTFGLKFVILATLTLFTKEIILF